MSAIKPPMTQVMIKHGYVDSVWHKGMTCILRSAGGGEIIYRNGCVEVLAVDEDHFDAVMNDLRTGEYYTCKRCGKSSTATYCDDCA